MNSNRGLDHDEKLLFEVGDVNRTGVDLSEPENLSQMLGDSFSDSEIGLAKPSYPGLDAYGPVWPKPVIEQ